MRNAPTNSDDIIDSRDVIAHIEDLEAEREALTDAHVEALDEFTAVPGGEEFDDARVDAEEAFRDALKALQEWDDENLAELETLQSLASQAEGYADDWWHGATLIRDSYFETYAQADYTSVEFGGITYWVR